MTGHPGHLTSIGQAVDCGHHTHSDREFLVCLARAWGITVPQLRVLLLGLLLSDSEHELTNPARVPHLPPVRIVPPPPATAPPGGAPRQRSKWTVSPSVGTQTQRRRVLEEHLRDNPNTTGAEAHRALMRAGFAVKRRTAHADLAAVRKGTP